MTKRSLILAIIGLCLVFNVAAVAQESKQIPQRSDIDDKYKWRVEDIYEDTIAWQADYEKLEAGIPLFEQYRGKLGESPENLLACLKHSEAMDMILGNLYVYAFLKKDEDTRVSAYQSLGGRAAQIYGMLSEAQAFILPEVISLGEEKVMGMLDGNAELEVYRHHFSDQFRQQAHILSEKEEAILAAAMPVIRAPSDIFDMIDNADHKMGRIVTTAGDTVELTRGRYYDLLREADRETRRIANDTVQLSWHRYINTLASVYGASVKKDWFLARTRGYESSLHASLSSYNVPVEVYENLIKATNENLHHLHKWYSLRKKFFELDTQYTYDLSLSMVEASNRKIPFEEGVEVMLKGFKPMGKEFIEEVREGLNSGWVDVYETEGKASGAYQWGTYTSHPYVLLNYNDKIDDVFTLAHEIGHAMHAVYTNKTEPYVYAGHTMFTAEVASTCMEAILMKHLLETTKDKNEKLALLYYYIKQIDGTFFTQVMFSEFEHEAHRHAESGGAFSADYFRQTYRDIFQKYMGPDVVIGPNNDMGGLKISHFYRNYYVYQYATSYAASQALSQKILEGDKKALEAYMHFLATGTSKYPLQILQDAGVDLTQPEPVAYTLQLFGELVDEMERLLMEE